jgi:hypothetical protein
MDVLAVKSFIETHLRPARFWVNRRQKIQGCARGERVWRNAQENANRENCGEQQKIASAMGKRV